jgi:Arc/MetJ-type ribon-helix-helix transcriptional regulator
MNVALTPEMEDFVEAQVCSGRFQNHSHLFEEAQKLLITSSVAPPNAPKTEDAARKKSLDRFNQGLGLPAEEVFRRLQRQFSVEPRT